MENNNKTKKELDSKKLMLIIIASLALIIIVLLVVLIIKSGSKQPVVNNDATPEPTLSADHFETLENSEKNTRICNALMGLLDEVLFIEDANEKGKYHPRISAQFTYS